MLLGLILILVSGRTALAQCTGCPNASFGSSPRVFEGDDRFFDIARGDFNRDGLRDVIVSNQYGEGSLLLYLGSGRGGFAPSKSIGTRENPRALAIGDFNGDGFSDVAHTWGIQSRISVLLGGPDATFAPPADYMVGQDSSDLAAADLNLDQKADLVVVNQNSNNLSIFLGAESGVLVASGTKAAGSRPGRIEIADLNSDSHPDLAITNVGEKALSVHLGNGDGTFNPPQNFSVPSTPFALAIGRFNADAYLDLAVSGGGLFEPPFLSILLGAGDGGFGTANLAAPIAVMSTLRAADFNGDGKDDIAAIHGGIKLLLNGGDGSFPSVQTFPGGRSPVSFDYGDFNTDGRLDIAVADSGIGNHTLTILLGDGAGLTTTAAYSPAIPDPGQFTVRDFNHDGRSDLVITDRSSAYYPNGALSVLLAGADGSLSPAGLYTVGYSPFSIVNGDLDGDGNYDLVVSHSGGASIFLGSGNGSFSVAGGVGQSVAALALSDFNEDDKLDLAAAHNQGFLIMLGDGSGAFGEPINREGFGGPIFAADFNEDARADVMIGDRIYLGDGTGHFGEPFFLPPSITYSLAEDVNGDSHIDVVGLGAVERVFVLLGNGVGGFGAPRSFVVGAYPRSVVAGDLNLDGAPDLAVANWFSDTVSVLRGDGTGTFATAENLLVGFAPLFLGSGDLNGDGRVDLVTSNQDSNDLSGLLNTNCQPRRLGIVRNVSVCNVPGTPFEKQPIVGVYDDGDNVVSCVGGNVQASILPGSGSPGANLSGSTAATLASGTAIFSDLAVDAVGEGFVLQFSKAGLLSTRSRAFRVDPACKGPFKFFTLAPCRIADTRNAFGIWGGPSLSGNSVRTLPIAGRCGVPVTARSVAVNLTVVSPTDFGHLTLFPAGRGSPLASTINFRTGIVRANNAILSLGDEGDVDVLCAMPPGAGKLVDLVLDVSGYFE